MNNQPTHFTSEQTAKNVANRPVKSSACGDGAELARTDAGGSVLSCFDGVQLYRILEPDSGEYLRKGDLLYTGIGPSILSPPGNDWIGVEYRNTMTRLALRPINIAPPPIAKEDDGWVRLSERKPLHSEYPVQVTDGVIVTATEIICSESYNDPAMRSMPSSWRLKQKATHWKPLKLSPPPKPQKQAEEIAFEKYIRLAERQDEQIAFRSCWLAALEFARKEKGL